MALNLVMLGPPAAGKGTQAKELARGRRIPHISTGDMLREAVQAGTPVGLAAKALMDAGSLVGDDVIIAVVRERLDRADTRDGFVLDGFPRTVAQAEALDTLMSGRAPLVILEIAVPTEVLVERACSRRICSRCAAPAMPKDTVCASCGGPLVQRRDDTEEIVRERLRVYDRDTRPLVAYYGNRPTFRALDGVQSPDAVAAAIQQAVDSVARASGPQS